jgi:RNA recognition motif-containing protein
MINDRDTGRFRGFAFVAMEAEAADAATNALNGYSFGGRPLKVNEAKPKEARPGGSGGSGGYGGGSSRGGQGGGNRDRYSSNRGSSSNRW